tara:strand:+ start:6402 stop:6575 length:174 start_codon:yes stop_codon:yes gene_type:complete
MINSQQKIQEIESTLTGNLWDDAPKMAEIYEIKKTLTPAQEQQEEVEEEDDCLYCGS